jgi:LysM repeat protein
MASLQNTVFTTVPSGRSFYHRVRKGDTLTSIAARYGVTPQELRGWNKGLGGSLVDGQRLRVVSDVAPAAGKKSKRSRSATASVKPPTATGRGKQSGSQGGHRPAAIARP